MAFLLEGILSLPTYIFHIFRYDTDYSKAIDIIDFSSNIRVASGNLSFARQGLALARFGPNQCVVVGGYDATTIHNTAEIITVDNTTGALISVQNISYYVVAAWDIACLTLPDSTVYCTGGNDGGNIVADGAFFNGTDWVRLDYPQLITFSRKHAGTCLLWGTDVWCCGGITSGLTPDYCSILDTQTLTWTNFTVTQRHRSGVFLIQYPSPQLLLVMGNNDTDYITSTDVITYDGTTYSLTTYGSGNLATTDPSGSGSIANYGFQIGYLTTPNEYTVSTLFLVGMSSSCFGFSFVISFFFCFWSFLSSSVFFFFKLVILIQ